MDLSEVLREKQSLRKKKEACRNNAGSEGSSIEVTTPVIEAPEIEQMFEVTFTVLGSREQLKALRKFMIDNKIKYGNGGTENGSK